MHNPTSPTPTDWTALTDNPCDSSAQQRISDYIESITDVWGNKRTTHVLDSLRNKDILDIGAGEHSIELYQESTWEHGLICKVAKSAVGLDIRQELVDHYNRKGFKFECVDATSEIDMGQRFDRIFIGDVIEHVNDPVKLLQFSKRHLRDDGMLILTTPNPFSLSCFFARLLKRRTVYVGNLDHVRWVSPTNALELGRRAGMVLRKVHLSHGNLEASTSNSIRHAVLTILNMFVSSECTHDEYVYEYSVR